MIKNKYALFQSLAVLLLLAISSTGTYGDNIIPTSPKEILKDINTVHSFYPRTEGSAGEAKVIDFILKRLDFLRANYSQYDFSESDNLHSFSRVIEVDIPGKGEDTLILAIPLNNIEGSGPAYDGAVNIALGLSLTREFLLHRPPLSLKILFLGAEYGDGENYPMGSKLFLRDFEPTFKTAVIYLEMKRIPSRLFIRGGSKGIIAPFWFMEKITEALKKTDIFFLLRGNENQMFRTSLTRERTIIGPYLNNGIPAVSLSGEYEKVTEEDKKDFVFAFNLFVQRLLEEFKSEFPEKWDKHYLFFQAKRFYFTISERLYIILFILLFALIIGYSMIFTRRVKKYLRTIWKSSWTYPLIFLITFGILFGATLLLELIINIKKMPDVWQDIPYFFLTEKILAGILLFSFLYPLLKKFPFSKNGSFYSASAIFFLLIDVVVLSLIDISYTYYFTWALLFAILFTLTSNRYLKFLFFLFSPYWILKATSELFSLQKLDFIRIILLSRIKGNILSAVLILPFVFMIIRLGLLFPPLHRRRNLPANRSKRIRIIAVISLIPALIIPLYTIFFFRPYGPDNPQPLVVNESIDLSKKNSSILITSPAPIGTIKYIRKGKGISISTGSRLYRMPIEMPERLIDYDLSSRVFLDRRNFVLNINTKGKPYQFKIEVVSDNEFILYDSNFPFQRGKNGKSYRIFIGKNPPKPLVLQLTLPKEHYYKLEINVIYNEPQANETIIGENKKVRWILNVKDEISLKT